MTTTLDRGQSTLVLGPPLPSTDGSLPAVLDPLPSDSRVLHVDYVRSPQTRLREWTRDDRTPPTELATLQVGAGPPSRSVERLGRSLDVPTRSRTVSDPENLARVGLELVKYLDGADEDGRTYVCLHSLSVALQFVPVARVLQFLDACDRLLDGSHASGLFYFTPETHSQRTVDRVLGWFDPAGHTSQQSEGAAP